MSRFETFRDTRKRFIEVLISISLGSGIVRVIFTEFRSIPRKTSSHVGPSIFAVINVKSKFSQEAQESI